jgi:integral membrane sensor domain MASE1
MGCLLKFPSLSYSVRVGILFAIYFSTAKLGLMMDAVSGFATAVWPPTGISLVALAIFGYRLWPGIALGAFLVNVSVGAPPLVALGMAAGNTLEAVLGTYLLQRVVGFGPGLDRLRDVLGLVVLAAMLSTMLSATMGVSSGWLGGVIPWANYGKAWWTWWLGNMIGDLVLAPLLFVWAGRPHLSLPPRRVVEAGALLVSVVAVSLLVFGGMLATKITESPHILFPVLIWAGLRFGQPGAVTATFMISVIAIWGTAQGFGPFAGEALNESLATAQK